RIPLHCGRGPVRFHLNPQQKNYRRQIMLQSLIRYVWILFTPVIASLSCPVMAQADCHIDKAVYDVTPQDERYLEYLRYENRFDSAAVSYTLGEVRLTQNGQEQKITLRSFANEF